MREGIADGHVLQTEVGHVDQVFRLRIEVVAAIVHDAGGDGATTGATAEEGRELGVLVDVLGSDLLSGHVAHLVGVDTVDATHERHHEGRLGPHVTLADALHVEVEVEAVPAAAQTEGVLITRRGVTDLDEVAMIVRRTFAPVDHTVTVLVHELDVARAEFELAGFQFGLGRRRRHIGGGLEVTVGFEAPDLTIFLAGIVAVDQVVAVPFRDFGLIVGQVGGSVHVDGAEGVVPVNVEFPAAGAERTGILIGGRSAEDGRQGLARGEHADGVALEPVEG